MRSHWGVSSNHRDLPSCDQCVYLEAVCWHAVLNMEHRNRRREFPMKIRKELQMNGLKVKMMRASLCNLTFPWQQLHSLFRRSTGLNLCGLMTTKERSDANGYQRHADHTNKSGFWAKVNFMGETKPWRKRRKTEQIQSFRENVLHTDETKLFFNLAWCSKMLQLYLCFSFLLISGYLPFIVMKTKTLQFGIWTAGTHLMIKRMVD